MRSTLSAFVLRRNPVALLSAGLLLTCFISLLAPPSWSGNEINYFDLAHRWIEPDQFSDAHAARDSSIGRIVSFLVMGTGIKWLGMEAAYHLFRLFFLIASPFAYLVLMRAFKTDLTVAALTLMVMFVYGQQSLIGGEFLFGSIEPKSFAYLCVFFGLERAMQGQRVQAAVMFSVAVYFHFLVGAFWGVAACGYYLIQDRRWRGGLPAFGLFASLTLPLFIAILLERSGGAPALIDGTQPSLNAIYAEFRNPHHIAPFADMSRFFANWMWGIFLHAAFALLFGLHACQRHSSGRDVSVWIASLNLYLVVAAIVAFFDRTTHFFALFYLFRPSALTMLLTILWGVTLIMRREWRWKSHLIIAALVVSLSLVLPRSFDSISRTLHGPQPLASFPTSSQAQMIAWVKTQTDPDSIILIEPLRSAPFMGEGGGIWVGMERLLERPTLVNFKQVPTAKPDLARWYQLLLWRQSVFENGCAQLGQYQVDYLITRTAATVDRLSDCSERVWRGDANAVLAVRSGSPPMPDR